MPVHDRTRAELDTDRQTSAQDGTTRPREEPDQAIPGVTDDPVLSLLLRGEAQTLYEAEEKYLDTSLPEVYRLAGSSLSNEELARHPLYRLLLAHGGRGWEDSLL